MKFTRQALSIVAAVIAISQLVAQNATNLTLLINTDSTSTIRVIQPRALETLLQQGENIVEVEAERGYEAEDDGVVSGKVAGYRVQVFSDNNQRTAKGEARAKELQIREAFPDFGTYIVYNSPFWRLKVGDFKTQHEAEAAADAIKNHFPTFAREVRVVRDRVNVQR